MNNAYLPALRQPRWNGLWAMLAFLLLLLPQMGQAQSTLSLTPSTLQDYGDVAINQVSAARAFTLSGSSLNNTRVVSVIIPPGFQGSFSPNSGYTTDPAGGSLNFFPVNGSIPTENSTVYLRFAPTRTGVYTDVLYAQNRNTFSNDVDVRGNGLASATLTVTYAPNPLDFGSTQVGTATTSQSFRVNASGLGMSSVTITATPNFQVRVGNGVFSSSATIAPVNGSVTNVDVDVRFTPSSTGTVQENITVTAPNAPTQSVAVRGQGQQAPPTATVNATPSPLAFGNVTQSGSAGALTLTVSGTNLRTGSTSNPITLTPSNANIQIRNASAGGSFSSGVLTIASTNGTVVPTTIEVRLVGPLAGGAFSGTIAVASAQATTVNVVVTATSNGNVSDISTTNPSNNTFTFATRPNTVSASQVFQLSGTNLLQDIIVTATGPSGFYFQVSKDNVNFSSSVTYQRNSSGDVLQAPVYVRFVPGSNAVTVSALIRASSSPAPDRDVSVTGISEPTVRLSEPIGSFGNSTVKNTTSAAKTVRLETFLLSGPLSLYFPNDDQDPQRNPDRVPQYEFSTDGGATYVKADTLLNNAEGNRVINNLLVRYAPTRVGTAAQSLFFMNSAVNSNLPFSLSSNNGNVTGFAIAEVPTAQSTAQVLRTPGSTRATITFNLTNPPTGQSYGQNRLVIGSTRYSQLPTSLFPQARQNFSPGTTSGGDYQFGSGSVIEANTTFVVFSGATNSFTVGNLNPNQEYFFYSFEFNDDGLLNAENYRVPNNQPQTPLPVELISFEAKLRNGRVLLNWATALEKNNRGFEIERSANASDFSSIGFKAGQGSTTRRTEYNYVDDKPLPGTSYYRLKQIDFDGTVSYSPVLSVRSGRTAEVAVFPNPVDDVLTIRLAEPNVNTKVTVLDLMGRTVMSGSLSANGTFNTSSLKAGNYIIVVTNGADRSTHKITKR